MRLPYQIEDNPELRQALSYVYSMLTQKVQAKRAQQAGAVASDSSDSDRKSLDGTVAGDPIAYISKPKGAYREYAGQTLMLLISTRRSGSRSDLCAQPYYNPASILALADMAAAYQDELMPKHQNFPVGGKLAEFVNADIIHCFSEQNNLAQFSKLHATPLSSFFLELQSQEDPQITKEAVEALFKLLRSMWNFMNKAGGPVVSAKDQEQAWSRDFDKRLEDAVGVPLRQRFGIVEMSSFINHLSDDWLLELRDKCLKDPSFSFFNCWVNDSRDYVARHIPEQGEFSPELQLFRLLGSMLTLAFERRVFELLQQQKHLVVYDGSALNVLKGLLQKCSLSLAEPPAQKADAMVLGRTDGVHLSAFLPAAAAPAAVVRPGRSGSGDETGLPLLPPSPEQIGGPAPSSPPSSPIANVLDLRAVKRPAAVIERALRELFQSGNAVQFSDTIYYPANMQQEHPDKYQMVINGIEVSEQGCALFPVSNDASGRAALVQQIDVYFKNNPPTPPRRDASPAPAALPRRRGSASDLSVVISDNPQQVFAAAAVAAAVTLRSPARSPTAQVSGSS